jgi:hypothetical protein
MPSEQTAALIDMGHDGVIAKREGKTEEIVAFHPNQIKSAIGNQGTFDPKDPDITKADGGPAMFQGIHPDLQGEGGAPLDLYHGTTQDKEFEAFDDSKLGARDAGFYGRGHYLTPEKEIADSYASSNDEYDFDGEPVKGAVIGPLHAALKNPYVWDVSDDMKSSKTLRDLQSMGIMRDKNELNSWDNLQSHHVRPFMAEMQKRGHDGVIVKTGHEHLPNGIAEVVAFDPKTIKHKEAEVFDPTDPRIRREDGGEVEGRVSYGNGGKSLGLYSKAAQIIRNQPQAKGSVDQLLAMVSKTKGVKPAELTNAGRPAGDTMSKEELAKHFEDALPKVDVERIGGRDSNGFPQYEDYTLPGGENYREHLLHLAPQEGSIDKRRKELEDQYKNVSTVADLDRITSQINALSNDDKGANFKSSHWNTPNVLAHVRMSDRDNGKTLHVHEVQSDWGQEGRENGFHDPKKPFEVVHKKTKEVVSRHPDYSSMWDAYRTHPDSDNLTYGDVRDEKPPQAPYVGNTQQWTDLALKHIMAEAAKGGYERVVFSPGEANADLYGQRKEVSKLEFLKSNDSGEAGILSGFTPNGYYSSQHDVESHADLPKLIGKENAANLLAQPPTPSPDKGEDRYTHTLQGPLQVGGHGMVDYYKNYVNQGAMKLLQQHDQSAKPESYDLPEGYKGFALPVTDTARESILKNGFQAFKRGGEVHKATGGEVDGDDEFEVGKKYNGVIPQIKYLPVHAIERQPSQYEVSHVSDDVAKNMDFSEPVEATAFRYSSNNREDHPSVALQNGHHRLAAARQTGRPHLPVTLTAVNAKGEKLNALKALSDEIERGMISKATGGPVMGYVPMASLTVPRLAVARAPQYQQQQGGEVDGDGITAYHASPNEIVGQFKPSSRDVGIHFAANPDLAHNAAVKSLMSRPDMAEKVSPKAFKINARPEQIVDIPAASNRFDFYDILEHLHGTGRIDSDTFNSTFDGLQDIEDKISNPDETMKAQNVLFSKALSGSNIKALRYMNNFDAGPTWKDMEEGRMTSNVTPDHSYIVTDPSAIQHQGVAKATGGPVMGYVPMASLTVPRLAVARAPQYQQQQGGVGKFSDSLNSLMKTVEDFKKKPEADAERPASAPSPSAASEGRTQLGMIAMPDEGYEATGMYAPFQSAIDRMIADAPGKITVASGYRTPEEQEALWNEHAAKYPDPEDRDDYVARAGQSSHNYGLAADLSYADQEAIKWAQENAAKYGLNFRMGHENWHIEPSNIWELRNAMTVPGYATGGSINKALAITRGFTKDGKSAINALKPKGK